MHAQRVPFRSVVLSLVTVAVSVPTYLRAQELRDVIFRPAAPSEWWQAAWWAEWETEGDVAGIVERLEFCGAPADWHITDFSG